MMNDSVEVVLIRFLAARSRRVAQKARDVELVWKFDRACDLPPGQAKAFQLDRENRRGSVNCELLHGINRALAPGSAGTEQEVSDSDMWWPDICKHDSLLAFVLVRSTDGIRRCEMSQRLRQGGAVALVDIQAYV